MNIVDASIEEKIKPFGVTISDLANRYDCSDRKSAIRTAIAYFSNEQLALTELESAAEYICHLSDVIDRMQMAIVNAADYMNKPSAEDTRGFAKTSLSVRSMLKMMPKQCHVKVVYTETRGCEFVTTASTALDLIVDTALDKFYVESISIEEFERNDTLIRIEAKCVEWTEECDEEN